MPPIAPGVAQNPVLTEEDQIPLQRDWVPVQGHVVVEDPAPQVRPGSEEHQEKLAPVPVDTKQNMVELEIKVKPQVGEEHEGEVKTEVKKEPEVKPEPDVKAEPEVNVEQKLKAESEVKPEPDVKAEPEVKVEQKLKAEPEVKPEPDVKAEPEVKVEQKLKAEPEVETEPDDKAEPVVNVEQKLKAEPEAKPEPDVKAEQEVEVEQELKAEPEVKDEFQVQMNLEAETETGQEIEERHIDMEGKSEMVGEPNMELEPLDDDNMELSEEEESLRAAFTNQDHVIQPMLEEEGLMRERNNLDGEPIMELEPEVKSEVDVEPDVQEEFQGKMNLEEETEMGQEIEERHIDMEGKNEMAGEPIMELEPLDDELSEEEKSLRAAFTNENPVNHRLPAEGGLLMSEMDYDYEEEPIMELEPLDDDNTEMSDTEKSLRAAFQNQDPVNQPLSEEEEEEGVMRKRDNVLDGEPIMELEPEEEEPSLHQHVMPDAAIMYGSGPALDIMGQQMPSLEEYFPNEEARMGIEPGQQQDSHTVEGSEYLMIEEPGREFVREEELSPMALFEEPDMNYVPALDGGVQTGVAPKRERRALMMNGKSHCPGVILEEKCYQFFKEPKRAADAEFFCQEHFAGGHLASITSQHIHREVMNMMLRQNGAYTRTWIGGLRYLETGRFLWLDGSHWSYADWLSGEPNNTSDVEDCVEVLAHGNGKFNDFTCWEPQAFICSYPY
ncbi:histone acetyltransferase KAT6B-like isoform X2 [Sebastes umbrosus]|uniref:histone acetyltransferase KAT6B-like isoform X2 n=1 Tax=Sebastes umbrosus TaxID=72105 RepID=UPI0018A0FF33|nr:histone acetyltransferase KAT6B-like isoform X2 [Sebastes umbrosus]